MGKAHPLESDDAQSPNPVKPWWSNLGQSLAAKVNGFRLHRRVNRWFAVDPDRLAEILQTVRDQLPTTEALLIGKPQAGKSSIIRGLTGVSAAIVGQGFRPHTQYTQRYAYPSEDLPLLIFTDTVGLGDLAQNTEAILGDLEQDLQGSRRQARILILTVKITDFATDSLRQIALGLRQQFPSVPCLLAVTSAHEVYPADLDNHPPYPPTLAAVTRPLAAIAANFQGLVDRTVLIDFTLEEDGFSPVFYGLEALRDALADLLPEAEAQALYQLLDEQKEAAEQLGNLYRDVGRHYISAFAVIAATLAAVPLPFATMPVLTALQVSMVGVLGQLYGQTLSPAQAGGVASAIAGGFFAQAIGRELVKFIPGLGSVIAASWAAAYTWALGEGACVYFGDLMGGKKPDPKKIQRAMQQAFASAQARFKDQPPNSP
ncbi:MAG TPA: 50S ribosome-binding GTPase [Leptolyngbyaceae cyanobacterium M65_K2018_010]|nr:50S ribosome-binding GTPase [Leptolyngbyaceae cyanobacterium M65_K2018_010]